MEGTINLLFLRSREQLKLFHVRDTNCLSSTTFGRKIFPFMGNVLYLLLKLKGIKHMDDKHFLNVKKILEDRGVKKSEIAQFLFPDVKFPLRAFARILTGEAELSASQVHMLAERLGCDIVDLYEPDRWVWNDTKDGKHIFIYGTNFRVEVDLNTWESVLYYKNDVIERGTFCNGNTPIGEFFDLMRSKVQDWIDFA